MNKQQYSGLLGLFAACAVGVITSQASAGMNISGYICQPQSSADRPNIGWNQESVRNNGTSNPMNITCAVPIDYNIGVIQWTFTGADNHASQAVTCLGETFDNTNSLKFSSQPITSDATGNFKKNPPNGPSTTNDDRHYAKCTLPPKTGATPSNVRGLRLY